MRFADHPTRGSGLLELLPAGAALDAARQALTKLSQVEQDTVRTCSMELVAALGRFLSANSRPLDKGI